MVTAAPYIIGVTGGIGSGKSVVSRLLRLMGVPVYDCDSEAKRLMHQTTGIREMLVALVGGGVYDSDGRLDRSYLASFMFGNPDRVAQVNRIVHPVVRADFRRWAQKTGRAVVAVESAILFEAEMDADVDAVWVVCAPEDVRVQRAMWRDGTSEEAVRSRMQCQLAEEEYARRASALIRNDGRCSLIAQARHLLHEISDK